MITFVYMHVAAKVDVFTCPSKLNELFIIYYVPNHFEKAMWVSSTRISAYNKPIRFVAVGLHIGLSPHNIFDENAAVSP